MQIMTEFRLGEDLLRQLQENSVDVKKQLSVQVSFAESMDELAGTCVRKYKNGIGIVNFFSRLSFVLPNPLIESYLNTTIKRVDGFFDRVLPEAMELGLDFSPTLQARIKRQRCFYLACSLVKHAQEIDPPLVQDSILLAARRTLLYGASVTESLERRRVNQEWLSGFFGQILGGRVETADFIKFIDGPPAINLT